MKNYIFNIILIIFINVLMTKSKTYKYKLEFSEDDVDYNQLIKFKCKEGIFNFLFINYNIIL